MVILIKLIGSNIENNVVIGIEIRKKKILELTKEDYNIFR